MTAYKKNLAAWLAIMISGIFWIALALYVSNWFLVPFIATVFLSRLVLIRVTCPNCGTPLIYEGEGVYRRFRPPTAFFRKKCARCGWNLT